MPNATAGLLDLLFTLSIGVAPVGLASVGAWWLCFVFGVSPGWTLGIVVVCFLLGGLVGVRMALSTSRSRGALRFMTALSATPELDITANISALRSGDTARIKNALRFLAEIGPRAMRAHEEVEKHVGGNDPEITELARAALRAIGKSDS